MQGNTIRDTLREEIVGKSIQILRSHGKSEKEIKDMMLKDFSIEESNGSKAHITLEPLI